MTPRRITAALKVLVPLMVLSAALAYTVLQSRSGAWTALWKTATLTSFQSEGGFAYASPTGLPDLSSQDRPSAAIVYENGQIAGRANASQSDIRELGQGRFSFWQDRVFLSATDNSNPASNGRVYTIRYPPFTRAHAWMAYSVTMALWAAGGLACLLLLFMLGWKRAVAQLLATTIATVQAIANGMNRAVPAQKISSGGLIAAWAIAALLVVTAETIYLTRNAEWTWLWTEVAVGTIEPEQGFGYVAHTGRPDIGSQDYPQATELLENGVQLGLRNAPHSEIREVGRGRYSFWHDYVLFASTDNSDPRTNGRRYTIRASPFSRATARTSYGAAMLALVVAAALTLIRVRSGALQLSPATRQFLSRHAVSTVSALMVTSLILPALLRASPFGAPLAEQVWKIVLVLQLAVGVGVWWWWGGVVPRGLRVASVATVALGFAILTVWAPHRTEGCHTNGAKYPVWSLYCVAPDSASYYIGFTAGSTRQPLYPWFIQAVVSGTSFNPQQFVDSVKPGQPRFEPDPLFRVVHAQIVLLLAVALIACWTAMGWMGSTLPAAIFLWLYDMQFFSVEELNIILTEPLVQVFTLLATAAYAAFLARSRPLSLLAVAAACGLAYLTRQAALYAVVLLLALIVFALFENLKHWWRWCLAALALFVALVAVTDVYAFVTTGDLSRRQANLQYQYRIAHAMQYATPEDVALMPDEESRVWLADAIVRRDEAHRRVELQFKDDELNRMIYYIAANLYEVATPVAGFRGENKTPDFYMKVATPILKRHIAEYARFSFRFWQFGVAKPGLARLAMFDFSVWYAYLLLGVLIVRLRSRTAFAAAAMILSHWAAVAIICLAAVPIPRMINASEYLVVLAGMILVFEGVIRLVLPHSGQPPA